jgi:hypothetical protein
MVTFSVLMTCANGAFETGAGPLGTHSARCHGSVWYTVMPPDDSHPRRPRWPCFGHFWAALHNYLPLRAWWGASIALHEDEKALRLSR